PHIAQHIRQRCCEPALPAFEHAADTSHAAEIGGRIIYRIQYRPVIGKHFAARTLGFEVETRRALIALILWSRRAVAGKEATLAQQAASQLCRRQRVQQPHRAYRDRRIFNALDDPLGGASLLVIETNDEAGEYDNARTIYFVDALLQAAPRILLLPHQY